MTPMQNEDAVQPDREALGAAVARFDWYHTIDLGGGIVTPGIYDLRPYLDRFGVPARADGKTVLDVGPGNGFFSFVFEERGARVTTAELPSWTAHDASPVLQAFYRTRPLSDRQTNIHGAIALAAEARGSRIERRFCNVYDIGPETTGVADIVFCASVLLHLTDPLRALYRIFSVTREVAIISTAIYPEPSGEARALFEGTATGHTFWLPNRTCLQQMARAAGFTRVEWVATFDLMSADGTFDNTHGTIRAFTA